MPSEALYDHTGNVDVRVSWGNDESELVQIVTQAAAREGMTDPTDRIIGIVNEWLADADMAQINLATLKAQMTAVPHFDGWWATLGNWGQVNRLIKILQRARDRSFGSPA